MTIGVSVVIGQKLLQLLFRQAAPLRTCTDPVAEALQFGDIGSAIFPANGHRLLPGSVKEFGKAPLGFCL